MYFHLINQLLMLLEEQVNNWLIKKSLEVSQTFRDSIKIFFVSDSYPNLPVI